MLQYKDRFLHFIVDRKDFQPKLMTLKNALKWYSILVLLQIHVISLITARNDIENMHTYKSFMMSQHSYKTLIFAALFNTKINEIWLLFN